MTASLTCNSNTTEDYLINCSNVYATQLNMFKDLHKINLHGFAQSTQNFCFCYSSPANMVKSNSFTRRNNCLSSLKDSWLVSDRESFIPGYIQLQKSEYGCWVSGRYTGKLMYADDLVLILVTALMYMLCIIPHSVCSVLANPQCRYDSEYEKSHIVTIGHRHNADTSPVIVYEEKLPVTNDIKCYQGYCWS